MNETTADVVLASLVDRLAAALLARGQTVASAESCTGGWVAKCCTDLAGSSRWFERGWVTYSNAAKHEALGVDPALIARHGAVSRETVLAMAHGALTHSHAHWSLAVSGIAGPDGGSPEKPVGLVWFAWAGEAGREKTECRHLPGDRHEVRRQAVQRAIEGLLELLEDCI